MANETVDSRDRLSETSPHDRLDSWKEIAAYLNCSERTVRRWEEEGLPIHRHTHKKKAAIYAFKTEIDAWWRNGHERLKQIEDSKEEPPTAAVPWRRRTWLAAGALAALSVTVMWFNVGGLRDRLVGRAQHLRIESLAVLPLENLSRDPEQEYFADGMTDQLITDLAQIPAVRVISRTSVMQYKKVGKPLDQIAQDLNIAAVVEGTVLRSGDRVRITVQLIQVKKEKHLWARSYEGDLRDVLGLQEQVARDVAAEIRVKLTPEVQGRLSNSRIVDPEVYEDYLRGRYHWNRRTAEGVNRGIDYFRQAIAKDPHYALAYAGLADSYLVLAGYRVVSPNEVLPLAKAAALNALEFDDSLAEAHTPLAVLRVEYDLDLPGAEKEFRRAIELNPNYATAHQWYGEEVLAATGRFPEALAELKRAEELDPLSLATHNIHGYVLYLARHNDEAIAQLRKTLDLDPNFPNTHMYLGRVFVQKRIFADAIAEFQRADTLSGGEPFYRAWLGYGYAVAGQTARAKRVLNQLKELPKSRYVPPYDVAAIWMGLGEKEQALKWLEMAYEDHAAYIPAISVEPVFEGLRSDPRFQNLLRRMNLPLDSATTSTFHN